ncbi:MAG TPA: NADH-quinone oxidoreductase subunit N [Nitrospiraceae bacterium]|jgi:NADH-quinone oxidoreductase subunit N|nr:NADH-quinone oxidoreductase subunit N [Nitrospiraceae bacterium]
MSLTDLLGLSPLVVLAAGAVVVMLVIAFYRNHAITASLTLVVLALALLLIPSISLTELGQKTPLLIVDPYALFYMRLILAAGFMVAAMSFGYLEKRQGNHEEFYLLLLLATLGSAVLAASSHFASFFLGLELLSVSLYALIAYLRENERGIEAGIKYLILAAVSAAFLLFGMALIYAETGTMEFAEIASRTARMGTHNALLLTAMVMVIVGVGFKLAVVPFHLWTPDVYEGAPAPVTAFVATVSKGSMFALLLRYFTGVDIHAYGPLFLVFTVIALLSMSAGNLLALLQNNIKRILAYSSIAHLGYLLVAFLSSGSLRVTAVTFYLVAYFVTTLGAFGIVTVLSGKDREADRIDDYRGMALHRPWLAGFFTAMLLSLAGIPLTAGFIGKFYIVTAGIGSALWLLVVMLVLNSAVGLFYYLRVILAMYLSLPEKEVKESPVASSRLSLSGSLVLAMLMLLLIGLGVYPSPLIHMIQAAVVGTY